MRRTIIDVARAAGVSKSTASRALQGQQPVSPEARRRVLEAAERLGYRVNRVARGLRAGSSHQLGLVVTNLVNASFHAVTTEMQACAHSEGYQLLLGVSQGDPEQEAESLSALIDHRVDGLVIVCTDRGVEAVNRIAESGTPVVGLVRRPPHLATPVVLGDDKRGAYEATQYLIGLGHRRIGYVGGLSSTTTGRARYEGYKLAHRDAGVPLDPVLVQRGPFDPNFGSAAVDRLLSSEPFTGLFIANHESVFGALPELMRKRVSVPDELSLVCYEDVPLFDCWHPPITVVDNAPAEMARTAFDLLVRQIEGHPMGDGDRVIRIQPRFKVRESCAVPRASEIDAAVG